jgi:hypothetical protein
LLISIPFAIPPSLGTRKRLIVSIVMSWTSIGENGCRAGAIVSYYHGTSTYTNIGL